MYEGHERRDFEAWNSLRQYRVGPLTRKLARVPRRMELAMCAGGGVDGDVSSGVDGNRGGEWAVAAGTLISRIGGGMCLALRRTSKPAQIAFTGLEGSIRGWAFVEMPLLGAVLSGVILDRSTGQVPVTSNDFRTFSGVRDSRKGFSIATRNSARVIRPSNDAARSSIAA